MSKTIECHWNVGTSIYLLATPVRGQIIVEQKRRRNQTIPFFSFLSSWRHAGESDSIQSICDADVIDIYLFQSIVQMDMDPRNKHDKTGI